MMFAYKKSNVRRSKITPYGRSVRFISFIDIWHSNGIIKLKTIHYAVFFDKILAKYLIITLMLKKLTNFKDYSKQ